MLQPDHLPLNDTTALLRAEPMAVSPRHTLLRPLPLGAVELDESGYWGAWQQVNATAIIEHCRSWMERVGWIGNFRAAAEGRLPRDRRGREFTDSDVYKLIEAMSWEHARAGDPALDAQIEDLVAIIALAQEPDGYLNTMFGRAGQAARYSDLEWGHELYDYGHLLQAAVARTRAVGTTRLLEVAMRVLDHLWVEFGPEGREAVCGHPEIEVALVEFGRLTGDERALRLAALFIDRRGRGTLAEIEFGREYYQDDMPVREATVFRGHAVRALYLAAGAVDVAMDAGDPALLAAIERQWARTLATRTYITGGMGSHHQDEAFGEDFELPNDRAYCETCAGVGAIMVAWRLLLATGDVAHADVLERVLHNVVATSPSHDGHAFFYANTLHQRVPGQAPDPDVQSRRASASQRSAWFEVSCCPTNVARTLATLGGLVATTTETGVQLHLYASGRVKADTAAGAIELRVDTAYPVDGRVRVEVIRAPGEWTLGLRIPGWSAATPVRTSARPDMIAVPGRHDIADLRAGDVVELDLDAAPRLVRPDARIDASRGCVAVEAGPAVQCLESHALSGAHPDRFVLDVAVPPVREKDGIVVEGWLEDLAAVDSWPYAVAPVSSPGAGPGYRRIRATLTPYAEWGEVAPGTMRIWLRAT